MNTSIHVEDHHMVIYPDFIRGGKKNALVGVVIAVVFLASCLWVAMTPGRVDILQLAGVILFSGLMLFTSLIQLTWGPLISMNEQYLSLRPNPFLDRIEVQWNEIEAFIPFTGRNHFFFEVTLTPAYREAFLLRQPPFMRKLLAKRLERSQAIARFSQRILPCAQTDLRGAIQELYHVQVQKYHISFGK